MSYIYIFFSMLSSMRVMKLSALTMAVSLFAINSISTPAFAKQCVYNHAWFILKVTWLWPYNMAVARNDQLTINQGTCTDDNKYVAVLSIVGGKYADLATRGAIDVAKWGLGFVPDIGPVLKAGADRLPDLPDPKEMFYIGVPSTEHYLDVWGTIWNPTMSQGGPIN